MPIKKVPESFSIERNIQPLLKAAGYKVRNIGSDYSWGEWAVNKHTRLWIEPQRPGHIGLKIIGPEAMAIAKTIEKESPRLDLQVTETERPKPGLLTRFFQSITKAEDFI